MASQNRKKSKISKLLKVVYISMFIALGFYSDSVIMIKILKIFAITITPIIGWILIKICIVFINSILDKKNNLSNLIRNKQFTEANRIINKRYNTSNSKKKKVYDFYKILINYYQIKEMTSTTTYQLEANLTEIKLYMEDIDNCAKEIEFNCNFMVAESYLLLYEKRKNQTDIENFEIALKRINDITASSLQYLDFISYNNYTMSRINLLFKANIITDEATYLDDILKLISELKLKAKANNQTLLFITNIEYYISKTHLKIYKLRFNISEINMAISNMENIETNLNHLKFYEKKYKSYGELMLINLYQQIIQVRNIPDIQNKLNRMKRGQALNKKEKIFVEQINSVPSISYPINNIYLKGKLCIKSKAITISLIIAMIVAFAYSTIHYFKPSININSPYSDLYNMESFTVLPVLHTDPQLFFENLYISSSNNGIAMKNKLSVEESCFFSTYLDDEEHIELTCMFDLNMNIQQLFLTVKEADKKDWNEIVPYIASLIQADNMLMDRDETISLINKLSNDLIVPTTEYANDREYTLLCRDNVLSLIICNSRLKDYFEFKSKY
ncbi:hypothetical protein [Abyssisolibacter fermentans]|uniref:hypothetical protein n=1 Tax=Abyssisolibacter fermentans TaxID=1766203 RepID=UPI000833949A|nr:hypothetical protein [Abyssisolibacter fermentans]